MSQPDVLLVREEQPRSGIAAWFRGLPARFEDSCIEAMVRQAELRMAEKIARAIRASAPEGCTSCTTWPKCTNCGRAEQAKTDADIAYRAGAGR
jgi:hypothetical protein